MADPYAPPGSSPARQPAPGSPDDRPADDRPGRAPRGGGSAPAPPRRPPPSDPRAVVRAATLVSRFSLLVVAGLVAATLHLPWRAGAVVFLVAGIVVGVMALVAAVRADARGGAVVAISLGLAATTMILALEVLQLALWPVTADVQQCQADALTRTARQACTADQQRSTQDLLRRLSR